MRVLVVGLNYSPEPTGIAPYTSAFARRLADRGHTVRVLTTMPHYPAWRIADGYEGPTRHEVIDGVHVTRVRHYVPTAPNGVRRLLSELSFGLRAVGIRWGRPDAIVFVTPALFATALCMIKARTRKRFAAAQVWVQDIYSLGFVETGQGSGSSAVARLITAVEAWTLRRASAVVVIHARFGAVAQRLGAAPERISVVRNWTHLPHLDDVDRPEARAELGWGGETIVLHSGAMGRKQHLDTVVEAARLADERALPIRFVLAGGGGERERLERLAAGVERIHFLDPLPDAAYWRALAAADVLLVNEHPGLREMAVPSKLTSYFASGRPVLAATEASSLTASEIEASGAGIRVDPGRPELLVDAALGLRADESRANDLGRLGQIYRANVLSEDAAIDRFDRLLREPRPA